MLNRTIFFGLLFLSVLLSSAFYFVLYSPKAEEQLKIKDQLKATMQKFNKAKMALSDLNNAEKILEKQKSELDRINGRIIESDQLSKITIKIRNFTHDYNLKLIDFTPIFEQYFADTTNNPIKALPFSVTVKGKFLDLGRYLENWENRDFFMIPDEIFVKELNPSTNELEAKITGSLYAWAREQD